MGNLRKYSEVFPLGESGFSVSRKRGSSVRRERRNPLNRIDAAIYASYRRWSNLSTLPPATLLALAEAMEKYFIYSAMDLCKVFMR